MTIKINLNADMAEGFGAYDIGDDAGILKIIGSANIACGFHAGDPLTMRTVVREAVREGVTIGAHPGFNDLWGFGRRRIDMRPEDLEYMVAYQIGALQAMATYSDAKVTHLKPHATTLSYLAEAARVVFRETGLLPHINPGLMSGADIDDLRKVSVSQGIMHSRTFCRSCISRRPISSLSITIGAVELLRISEKS